MEYPATQMFVNDDDADEDDEETDEDAGTPLRADKSVKVGTLLVDSAAYPVHKGLNRVGRLDVCSIVIDHNTISKEHAEIEAGSGSKSTFISDLGSLNKTKLNDVILRPGRMYQLQDGDVVRFGSVRAVFQAEKAKAARSSVRSRNSDDFVIPETPGPTAKAAHLVIPGTPDLSFDRSSAEVNRSSDLSVIAGTQEVGNGANGSSPSDRRGPAPNRDLDSGRGDDASGVTGPNDISDMETQKNSTGEDSDEENIFDMMTQKTDIHDDETQRFSIENPIAAKPLRCKIEPGSTALEDMETQKFSEYHGGAVARSESINDLETQKFDLRDAAHGPRPIVDGIQARPESINDMETQKFAVYDAAKKHSTFEASESKGDAVDSETDEEGIFDNSDDPVVDMFDAPTQLIRAPREASKSPVGIEAGNGTAVTGDGEEIEKPLVARQENEVRDPEEPAQTPNEARNDEGRRAALNDSIESKLNHMFDDVNETLVDEPTQMLTQHLENILESTQAEGTGFRKCAEDASGENAVGETSKSDDCRGGTGDIDDDDVAAKSDERVSPKEAYTAAVRVPEILSTQELFGDLPAVDIFGTPSKGLRRGRIKLSPLSDVTDSPRSTKSGRNIARNFSNGSRKERRDSGDSKRSNDERDAEAKVEDKAEPSVTPGRKRQRTPKAGGRKKPRIWDEVDNDDLGENDAKIEEPTEADSRKGLPLKKRGSSMLVGPQTPRKVVAEVVATVRVATRSNTKITTETGKRSTRVTAVDSPKTRKPKGSFEKPESSPGENEPLNRGRKSTRSGRLGEVSSGGEKSSKTEVGPQPMSSQGGNTRRTRKKPLDNSDPVTPEVVPPVKRAKVSNPALTPDTNEARPTARGETRRNPNPREVSLSESSEIGISQNESLPTRSRRTRPAASASNDGGRESSFAAENAGSLSHQPSLESQEIQAILGAVDQGDGEATASGLSRRRKEARVFPGRVEGKDLREESARQDFAGFSKAEIARDEELGFEKPTGRGERKKRPPARLRNDDEDLAETGVRRPSVRGKRNADLANRGNSLKPETSGSVAASRSPKSQGGPSKGEKIPAGNVVAEDPPPPKIEEAEPKIRASLPVRNRRGVAQRAVDRAGKENVVEEIAPKIGRKRTAEAKPRAKQNSTALLAEDEDRVSESPSPLRRGRSLLSTPTSGVSSSPRIRHKVLFTGLNDPRLVSIVNNLGGTVTEKPNDCTALVTDKVRRTYKFLCCMATGVPVVSVDWLKESDKRARFLDTGDFLLKDPAEEAKFGFDLRRSLAMATGDKLLDGYTVVLTPNTAPPPVVEMKGIIQACGGKVLARPPARWGENTLIISRQEDAKNAKKFLTKAPKSVRLLSVEFILTGVLRHELNFEEHKLEID